MTSRRWDFISADDALVAEIREIHTESGEAYGALRVHADLHGFGHHVNRSGWRG